MTDIFPWNEMNVTVWSQGNIQWIAFTRNNHIYKARAFWMEQINMATWHHNQSKQNRLKFSYGVKNEFRREKDETKQEQSSRIPDHCICIRTDFGVLERCVVSKEKVKNLCFCTLRIWVVSWLGLWWPGYRVLYSWLLLLQRFKSLINE